MLRDNENIPYDPTDNKRHLHVRRDKTMTVRAWPLDSFVQKNLNNRLSNPWNSPVNDRCADCRHTATLWVEQDIEVKGRRASLLRGYNGIPKVARSYGKLCEACYTLRILGDSCESPIAASDAPYTTTARASSQTR